MLSFYTFSCFRGLRRSVMTLCCVLMPCVFFRASVERWVSFRQLLDRFLGLGRAALLPFRMADPQSHKFVPAGATRPPTRQQIGSPSRFFPPLCGRFSDHFLVLFRFFRNYAILCKLSSRRSQSSILRIRGLSEYHFSCFSPFPIFLMVL